MAAFRLLLACCVLLVFSMSSDALPEPGKLKMEFTEYNEYLGFSKALYKEASISVQGKCSSTEKNTPKITISWRLKYTQCADYFATVKKDDLSVVWDRFPQHEMWGEDTVECNNHILLTDMSAQPERNNDTGVETSQKGDATDEGSENKKRDDKKGQTKAEVEDKTGDGDDKKQANKKKNGKKEKNNEGDTKKTSGDEKGESNDVPKTSNAKTQSKNADQKNKTKSKGKKQGRSVEMKDNMFRTLVHVKRDKVGEDEGSDPKQTGSSKDNKVVQKGGTTGGDDASSDSNVSTDGDKAAKDAGKKKKQTESELPKLPKHPESKKSSCIAHTRRDGIYLLIVTVTPAEPEKKGKEAPSFHLELNVAMESKSGYLSATDWPLLPFYGIMSLVYLFYGIVWLIVSACQWRDLLRIQFWIGGVIALGMLEKAVFYSEYNNINNTGITTPSLVVFAEIVSVAKRTLARMLVIIVSMGFGIVKPRLGKSLHRVLGVGALYFIIGIVEGCLRSLSFKADPSKEQLIAGIPLAVLDAAICWWIFMSLVQTTRTLRIRRNVIKLSLYRHFTNTLIFAVLASVAYMIWSIKTHKFAECIKDWSELWLDEAFWHFLFSIILLVIMVLWRPTANNQRYAFTPIVDFDDDEEDNVTLSEAFDGMKMRNTRTEVIVNGADPKKKAEDDLKWVEENIPSSAADTVLPSVLDSDEELMTTKFEMSKME